MLGFGTCSTSIFTKFDNNFDADSNHRYIVIRRLQLVLLSNSYDNLNFLISNGRIPFTINIVFKLTLNKFNKLSK